ncbi:acyl-CoA dehydrogenase family protein [Candidatus Poriferisodalis sp.]|uniref:acyl-CoA dehydrogenase family protein n=1 Tax=Candidatus Poriferisodalis sp. TaxID=3101277 RepID=UPI003C6FCA7D
MTDHAELVGRARELEPVVAERAADAEAMRRPPDETIRELIDAELFSILVPRRWGGLQGSLHTHREVVEIISAACMSTGWILAFYSGHNWMASLKRPKQSSSMARTTPSSRSPRRPRSASSRPMAV